MTVFECITESPATLARFFDIITHCCSVSTRENKTCEEAGCPIASFLPSHHLGCTSCEIIAWLESDAKRRATSMADEGSIESGG